MTPQEQIQRVKDLIAYINDELPIFAKQVLANDLAALVTNRVVQKGENFRGGSFSRYSSKTVAAWRFWGQSRTQAAEKKVRSLSRAKGALSYKEFRELNNLNSTKKNFEFTGEMWRKFGIVKEKKTSTGFRISLGGTTPGAQNKIDENSEREGISIIEANENEKSKVEDTTLNWVEQQAKRILDA